MNIRQIACPLIATKPGYPKIDIQECETVDRVTVSIDPLLLISDDGWTVRLKLYLPLEGCQLPSVSDILKMLEEESITWGIREKKISAAIEMGVKGDKPIITEIIVRGRLPVNRRRCKAAFQFLTRSQGRKRRQ